MTKYSIEMSRHQAVLYLAAEFGTRGAVRIMRGVKPFGDTEEAFPYLSTHGAWYRFDTNMFQASRHTKKFAESVMRRAAEFIAHKEGQLHQPLRGSAGIMRVVGD
jgi:hypothetical protein